VVGHLALLDLVLLDLAVLESDHKTFHALQSLPFGPTVFLITGHLTFFTLSVSDFMVFAQHRFPFFAAFVACTQHNVQGSVVSLPPACIALCVLLA
jgi:hypothetical protein